MGGTADADLRPALAVRAFPVLFAGRRFEGLLLTRVGATAERGVSLVYGDCALAPRRCPRPLELQAVSGTPCATGAPERGRRGCAWCGARWRWTTATAWSFRRDEGRSSSTRARRAAPASGDDSSAWSQRFVRSEADRPLPGPVLPRSAACAAPRGRRSRAHPERRAHPPQAGDLRSAVRHRLAMARVVERLGRRSPSVRRGQAC